MEPTMEAVVEMPSGAKPLGAVVQIDEGKIHAATHPAEAHATLTAAQRSAAEREGLLAALDADAKADEEAGG